MSESPDRPDQPERPSAGDDVAAESLAPPPAPGVEIAPPDVPAGHAAQRPPLAIDGEHDSQRQRTLYDAFLAEGHRPLAWDGAQHVGTIVDTVRDTLVMHVGRGHFMHVPASAHVRVGESVAIERDGSLVHERGRGDDHTRLVR